ncbi:hypothetical protein Hdeb2414_s0009g00321231 [Helianthus debilis subsp. tardiflorus]
MCMLHDTPTTEESSCSGSSTPKGLVIFNCILGCCHGLYLHLGLIEVEIKYITERNHPHKNLTKSIIPLHICFSFYVSSSYYTFGMRDINI